MAEKKGGKTMNDKSEAELRVVLETDGPKIECHGTRRDILTAWAWLTLSVCRNFDISEYDLAAKMPALLAFLGENIRGQTLVDMSGLPRPEEDHEAVEDAP